MLMLFKLIMPNVGSWNNQWTSQEKIFCVVRQVHKTICEDVLKNGPSYRYSFGDGWTAAVSCEVINASMAKKMRRLSKGFAGYDWMIDSILNHRDIRC